mmetsp:Transcript_31273/g.57246  ORF Transcript_31273/g.57246 Transcript_31273/m.57246 type:complete len:341 (+) Transcript_31273:758-1780(+)
MIVTTAFQRPTRPVPMTMMSTPNLSKLCISASCPELKAESVISSDDDEDENYDRFEPLLETPEEYAQAALSMDCPTVAIRVEESEPSQDPIIACGPLPELLDEPVIHVSPARKPPIRQLGTQPSLQPSVSSLSSTSSIDDRRKLQWEFKGLTLWLELEEFDSDITRAVEHFSSKHSSPFIPKSHTTAIYGMEHLSFAEAKERLRRVPSILQSGAWPAFSKPTGVTSDIAVCGKPGQVCSIAWSEMTLATDPEHEEAMDRLHRLFFGEGWDAGSRTRPWTPHNSIAYDNPDTNALSLLDTITYMSSVPSLLGRERRVEAMSLWSTEGKMEEWVCIDRVRFW